MNRNQFSTEIELVDIRGATCLPSKVRCVIRQPLCHQALEVTSFFNSICHVVMIEHCLLLVILKGNSRKILSGLHVTTLDKLAS